ncbi:hypothetical protein X976_5684 [Burkholderia pseudomallei MSHR7500]|nr:hypothetical protein X976_5684 [Burkholderia pseudomallei MSHR7500]
MLLNMAPTARVWVSPTPIEKFAPTVCDSSFFVRRFMSFSACM